MDNGQIKLNTSSILSVPIQTYNESFTFIVNGQEFKTTRLISDLLSTKISHLHVNDPTIDTYTINTKNTGNFSFFLELLNFENHILPDKELPFIIEVTKILDMTSIEINEDQFLELNKDNILNYLRIHEKDKDILNHFYRLEVEYISSHFHELCENHDEEFIPLQISTLTDIISNDHLRLKDEDQLIQFINRLSSQNDEYSVLYDHVFFPNVSANLMAEFLANFEVDQIDCSIWKSLCERLILPVKPVENKKISNRYFDVFYWQQFYYETDKPFNGIVDYLTKKTGGFIENEIDVTSSGVYNNDNMRNPRNVLLFNEKGKYFYSAQKSGSWLCLIFKNSFVIPSAYSLRTGNFGPSGGHMKNWALEGSLDNENWVILDNQNDCAFLKGSQFFHTFKIENSNRLKFKYIRVRSTGPNWTGNVSLLFEAIELFGVLIE